jgi:hypothetical protein
MLSILTYYALIINVIERSKLKLGSKKNLSRKKLRRTSAFHSEKLNPISVSFLIVGVKIGTRCLAHTNLGASDL